MKICVAQSESIKGACEENIQRHLKMIKQAAKEEADLVVFPELSITNYEPTIAAELAVTLDDPSLEVFQLYSNQYNIVIAIGMPLRAPNGIQIALFFFQPNQPRSSYAKQLLHEAEVPYFVNGNRFVYWSIKGEKIAFGICYESLQPAHLLQAVEDQATVYVASVAKTAEGMKKARAYFSSRAAEYGIAIALVNSVGVADTFVAGGNSAIWNNKGVLQAQLGTAVPGLVGVALE
ncbi:MAG: carbon-nitrogen hydrolase family protein [Aureispira sp.]